MSCKRSIKDGSTKYKDLLELFKKRAPVSGDILNEYISIIDQLEKDLSECHLSAVLVDIHNVGKIEQYMLDELPKDLEVIADEINKRLRNKATFRIAEQCCEKPGEGLELSMLALAFEGFEWSETEKGFIKRREKVGASFEAELD